MRTTPTKRSDKALVKAARYRDLAALKAIVKALNLCTSRRVLVATFDYLIDRYLVHPSKQLPEHLRP